MKILIIGRYSRMGASSRLRLFQYIPFFERNDIECTPEALLDDRYLEAAFEGRRLGPGYLLKRYLYILRRLGKVRRYDLVIIEKELFPFWPPVVEWGLHLLRIPFIVDYDDAIFHNYDRHPSRLVRMLLGNKIKSVMRWADTVVCGNEYLLDYARRAGASKALLVPTVIDTARYAQRVDAAGGELIVGWIGTPYTLKYLRALLPVFQELGHRRRVKIRIIGGKGGIGAGELEEVVTWTEADEAAWVSTFDIGVMPLEDTPWERGKCGYKLIQYMGCGVPVVGSPVGVNDQLIREGINGYKATTGEQWLEALDRLAGDPGLRERLGQAGRQIVCETYSLRVAEKTWLHEILQPEKRHA